MNRTLTLILVIVFLAHIAGWGQEQMTPARFREIVVLPGDNLPLNPKLATTGPLWTNTTVSISLKYRDGKTFAENATETTKTVGGKYVVTTVRSTFSKQPMDSILTYDEKASTYKVWALLGETIVEGRIVYDFQKKVYALNSAYGSGVTELGVGSYSDTENSSRTLIFTNGLLLCERISTTKPTNK